MEQFQFKNIAICLPGGGYRAACYSLGILKTLNDLNLTTEIRAISTVSGGTITGVKYAVSVAKKIEFDAFYKEVYSWFKKDELLENSLKTLREETNFGFKRHNLINAFAISYSELTNMTFGELEDLLLQKDENNINKVNLNEVIFNSTDFENGIQFRFRTKNGKFGNGRLEFSELKNQIKLSDIIAASSCFPAGFEPISFPNDFIGSIPPETKEKEIPIGLMDGGILDNLGVLSYLTGKRKYDTYIVGDAGKYRISGFDFSENSKLHRILSNLFSWWTIILIALITLLLIYLKVNYIISLISFGFLFLIGSLQLGLEFVLLFAKNRLNLQSSIKLSRGKIGLYLSDRIMSVIHMNNSIFLKGSKSTNLDLFYTKLGRKQICHTPIYKLNKEKTNESLFKELKIDISDDIRTLFHECSNMETTLWFTRNHKETNMLDKLVLCGQLSCCLSLIENLNQNIENISDVKKDLTFKRLKEHWNKLIKTDTVTNSTKIDIQPIIGSR